MVWCTCSKEIGPRVKKNDNHSWFHYQHNWGGVGGGEIIQPFIEHNNFHFDNVQEIHMGPKK